MQQIFTYEDAEFHFALTGNGPVVLLIHGFGEDASIWSGLIQELKPKFTLLTVDIPGFGKSPFSKGYSINSLGKAFAALTRHLGFVSYTVLGHSMGGYISMAMAALHTDALNGLGLIHTHPFADSPEIRKIREKSIRFIEAHGTKVYTRQLFTSLFPDHFRQSHPGIIEELIKAADHVSSAAFIAGQSAMLARPGREQVLASLDIPVLLVIGTEDQAIPAEINDAQIHLPKKGMIRVYNGVGHMSMFETPSKFREDILAFLDFVHSGV